MKKYNQFINEGVRDKMLPKSKEEIDEILKTVSPDKMLRIGLIQLRDLEMIKDAIRKGADPSRDNNVFLKEICLDWHYDNNIIDFLGGDLTRKDKYITDDWFIGHCLDESPENQKKIMDFYKEALKIFLNDKRVQEKLSAIEILGYRAILKLN